MQGYWATTENTLERPLTCLHDVRFGSKADMCAATRSCPLCANSGLMRCGKLLYSITVSTRASSVGGTVMPSDFAVFILRLKSSFVDCSTGSSPGFSPFKIRST